MCGNERVCVWLFLLIYSIAQSFIHWSKYWLVFSYLIFSPLLFLSVIFFLRLVSIVICDKTLLTKAERDAQTQSIILLYAVNATWNSEVVLYTHSIYSYTNVLKKKVFIPPSFQSKHIHTHSYTPHRTHTKMKVFCLIKSADWMNRGNANKEKRKKWDDGGVYRMCSFPSLLTLAPTFTLILSSSLIFFFNTRKKLLFALSLALSIYLEQQSEFDWHWLCQKWFSVSRPVGIYIYKPIYTSAYRLRTMNKMEPFHCKFSVKK